MEPASLYHPEYELPRSRFIEAYGMRFWPLYRAVPVSWVGDWNDSLTVLVRVSPLTGPGQPGGPRPFSSASKG